MIDLHPIQVGEIYSSTLHATETQDKHQADGPLGLYGDFIIIGTFKLYYEYELEYEYDFRISNR